MLNYFFSFATGMFNEIFNNSLLEVLPLMFLFVIGLVLLNMLRKVA